MYTYGIDFGRIEAVDIHTHVEIDGHGHRAYDDVLVEATARYFKMPSGIVAAVDAVADLYRQHNTAAVVFTIDARHGMRHAPNSIEDLVAGAARNNDVLLGWGGWAPRMASSSRREPVSIREPRSGDRHSTTTPIVSTD